jgi:hypothetical protein
MNYHKIKTTRKLASGEIKTYEYMVKYNYTPKGTKLKEIKDKYHDILFDNTLTKSEIYYKLIDSLTKEELKKYTYTQIKNLVYRI